MQFIEGTANLISGTTEYTIDFPEGLYVTPPTLVLASVTNTSADVTKYQLNALVTEITVDDFTI